MKVSRLVLVIVMLVASIVAIAPRSSAVLAAEEGLPTSCASFNDPTWDGTYFSGGGWLDAGSLNAGETITIMADWGEIALRNISVKAPGLARLAPASYEIMLWIDGSVVASAPFPGTLTYVVPADVTVTLGSEWWVDGMEDWVDWSVSCTTGTVAGCTTQIDLLPDSVVGAFVATADAYWAPGKLTYPLITIPANKTAWVLGVDKTGQYYKIVWVCQYLWVKIDTMGPNYDKVWNGKALPTGVVN